MYNHSLPIAPCPTNHECGQHFLQCSYRYSQGCGCIALAFTSQGVCLVIQYIAYHAAIRSLKKYPWTWRLCVAKSFPGGNGVCNNLLRPRLNLTQWSFPSARILVHTLTKTGRKSLGTLLDSMVLGMCVPYWTWFYTRCLPVRSAWLSSVVLWFSRYIARPYLYGVWEALADSNSSC